MIAKKPKKKARVRLASKKARTTESVAARAHELDTLAKGVCESPKIFSGVLAVLQDQTEAPQVRRAALRSLQAGSFSAVAFNVYRADYIAALRGLTHDPDLEIRQSVFGILSRERDGHAQRLLMQGLDNPPSALLPPEKALQLLGYDVHAEVYPIARKIVKRPPNPAAQREALRVLGADAASVSLFESILRDKAAEPELRRISASALQALKPDALQAHARAIVLDDDDDDDIRAAGLTALAQFGSAAALGGDEALRTKTNELKTKATATTKRAVKAFRTKYHGD